MPKLSAEYIQQLCDLYAEGKSIRNLSKMFDLNTKSVWCLLNNRNLLRHPEYFKSLTPEQEEQVVTLYQTGKGINYIKDLFKVSSTPIQKLLHRLGISRPKSSFRSHSINKGAFKQLTSDSAYWVGFLAADGSVNEGAGMVALQLSIQDRDHLEKFREFLGSSVSIVERVGSGYSKNKMCYLHVTSRDLVRDLVSYGVVQNKSKILEVCVPLSSDRNFWRGVIDGDGSIFVDNRFGKPVLSLVGSYKLMSQFRDFVIQHCPDCRASVNEHKSVFSFRVSGITAWFIICLLYYQSRISLDRKNECAQKIISNVELYKRKGGGADCSSAKLTNEQIKELRAFSSSDSQRSLARKYGVSQSTIGRILRYDGWI